MDTNRMLACDFVSMRTAKHEDAAIFAKNERNPNVFSDFGSA